MFIVNLAGDINFSTIKFKQVWLIKFYIGTPSIPNYKSFDFFNFKFD